MDKRRILIVDDEPGLLRLLALMLTHLGHYEVLTLVEANHAFEAVVESRPDLVLLDWIMPTMNGGDVARQIRSDSRVRDTRILFLSAIILKRDSPGELAGCPAVAKPIGIHELVEAIDEQLRQVA